jgi:hypothetical protein
MRKILIRYGYQFIAFTMLAYAGKCNATISPVTYNISYVPALTASAGS